MAYENIVIILLTSYQVIRREKKNSQEEIESPEKCSWIKMAPEKTPEKFSKKKKKQIPTGNNSHPDVSIHIQKNKNIDRVLVCELI